MRKSNATPNKLKTATEINNHKIIIGYSPIYFIKVGAVIFARCNIISKFI